jgi:23S rRNA (adenine-N6)-dimethyltransferase
LHNKRWIQTIIAQAKLAAHEQVIDIGAGLGALTIPLAKRANRVIAVEIDPDFADILRRKTAMFQHVKVLELDFLQMPLPYQPYCVVANIPYGVTTPILNKLLNPPSSFFQRAVLIIEKGAAKRFTERVTTNPQLLTWRMWFDFARGATIEAANFAPPPNVESSIFTITRKKEPLLPFTAHTAFRSLVTHALTVPQRR